MALDENISTTVWLYLGLAKENWLGDRDGTKEESSSATLAGLLLSEPTAAVSLQTFGEKRSGLLMKDTPPPSPPLSLVSVVQSAVSQSIQE